MLLNDGNVFRKATSFRWSEHFAMLWVLPLKLADQHPVHEDQFQALFGSSSYTDPYPAALWSTSFIKYVHSKHLQHRATGSCLAVPRLLATAGITEELLYQQYLQTYLQSSQQAPVACRALHWRCLQCTCTYHRVPGYQFCSWRSQTELETAL